MASSMNAVTSARKLSALLFVTALPVFGSFGCSAAGSSVNECADNHCNSGYPKGPVRGLRADGRVDIDAISAWPKRIAEPKPLTSEEIARACAIVGACTKSTAPQPEKDADLATATALCALPGSSEERAIPGGGSNERDSFTLRAILEKPTCESVVASTARPLPIHCEEDGCWWESSTPIPKVTCAGTVATLDSAGHVYSRDCARSYTACDSTSPTGCTDRAPIACDAKGKDRCDGDVKLGCDSGGRVSFHDCALVGRKCVESADGAACAPRDTTCDALSSCGDKSTQLTICATDHKVTVDCTALGFARCDFGHCAN